MSESHKFTIRWWHWLLLVAGFVIVMVITVALALRSYGRNELNAVLSGLRQAGKPVTLADFIAQAPTVDQNAQNAWNDWSKRAPDFPDYKNTERLDWDRWVSGHGPLPRDVADRGDALAVSFQPVLELLRHHDLVISTYGWIAADLPPSRQQLPYFNIVRMPNLLGVRTMYEWLRHRAVLAEDPSEGLADLNRLHHAVCRQPGTLIDAMIAIAGASIRDRTYLELALRGTLPAAAYKSWTSEPGQHLEWIAAGFDGERLLFGSGLMSMLERGPFGSDIYQAMGYGRGGIDLLVGPYFWSTGFHDCAILIQQEADLSARLRRERLDPIAPGLVERTRMWGFGRWFVANLSECAVSGLTAEAQHRMTRIAARLILAKRSEGLPRDLAELAMRLGEPDLLTPIGDHLFLCYELLAPDRFRISIAPSSPAPNFDDASRMAWRSQMVGKPPSASPVVVGQSVEIQLPPSYPSLTP